MDSFKEIQLSDELVKALKNLKFEKPTPVQSAVIEIAMTGKDVIACAETGSGKTAAYSIPMVSRLLENKEIKGLVLVPTRELAIQVAEFMKSLLKYCDHLQVVTLIGGTDMMKQLRALKKNPRIIIATPGRLTDHLQRKSIHLGQCQILTLDEGDRMIDMGFAPQLEQILKYLPNKRQTSLFTATLPKKAQLLAEKYLTDPELIEVGKTSVPVSAIKQSVITLHNAEKNARMLDELNARTGSVIVFTRTQRRTDQLTKNLAAYGFKIEQIHGGRTQGQRNRALKNFKSGVTRILCATDIAARGIDVPHVEHVINYDLPMMTEDYVHRVGRTARNGASGEALSLVTPEEIRDWNTIVKKYKIEGAELKDTSKPKDGKGRGKYKGSSLGGGNGTGTPSRKKRPGSAAGGGTGAKKYSKKSTSKPAKDNEKSETRDAFSKERSKKKSSGFKFTAKKKPSKNRSPKNPKRSTFTPS